MAIKFDTDQRRAVEELGESLTVTAGAGSGKTMVLVERYVNIILKGLAEPDEILAITFTNKAASEMKSRVTERLAEITVDETESEYVRVRSALDRMEAAPISTIHSFCQSVLKDNSTEAGLDPEFTVVENVRAAMARNEVIRNAIRGTIYTRDKDRAELLRRFKPAGLRALAEVVLRDRYRFFKAISTALEGENDASITAGRKRLNELFNRVYGIMSAGESWRGAIETLYDIKPLNTSDRLAGVREQVLERFGRLDDEEEFEGKYSLLREAAGSINLRGGSKNAWAEGDRELIKESLGVIRENIKALLGIEKIATLEETVPFVTRIEGFAKELVQQYEQELGRGTALDFDELLIRTRDLFAERNDVKQRYRRAFKHILVDEFQDTDEVQVEIIKELALGENDGSSNPILFIVGDAKQSIYRFRGAEVSNFRRVEKELAEKNPLALKYNYRSHPALIGFCNAFFGEFLGRSEPAEDFEQNYENLSEWREPFDGSGKVELLIAQPEGESDKSEQELMADLTARRIRRLMADEAEIEKKREIMKVDYRHICLLFSRLTYIRVYTDAMQRYQIPYYVHAGSGFYDRFEIRDLLNFFECIERRADWYPLASWLRSPVVGVSDDALFHLGVSGDFVGAFENPDRTLFSDEDRKRMEYALEELTRWRKVKDRVSVSELVTRAVNKLNYIPFLLGRERGEQMALNVYKLLDIAGRFDSGGSLTLNDFIHLVKEVKSTDEREGEAPGEAESGNAVTLMSIHRAKGLEFPVVLLPELSGQHVRKGHGILYDGESGVGLEWTTGLEKVRDPFHVLLGYLEKRKEEAERKRLLYVAMTRAEDYLFLVGAAVEDSKGKVGFRRGTWFQEIAGILKVNPEDIPKAIEYGDVEVEVRHEIELDETETEADVTGDEDISTVRRAKSLYTEPLSVRLELKRVTPTDVILYEECPWKYRLKHIEGMEEPDVASEGVGGSDEPGGTKLGTLTHNLFEALPFDGVVDTDELVAKILRKEKIDGAERARLSVQLTEFLTGFMGTDLYGEICAARERRKEEHFFTRIGDVLVEGVIDLIFTTGSGYTLLDYKTDMVTRENLGEHGKKYDIQLGLYTRAIENILSERPAKTLIYFVRERKSLKMPTGDEEMADFERRLARMAEGVNSAEFSKEPDSCAYCGYHKDYCTGAEEGESR